MTNRDKRFEKIICGREREYPYEWIKNFLNYFEYVGEQKASSHITFRRKNYRSIVIIVHRGLVNQVYVKRMVKNLKELQIL